MAAVALRGGQREVSELPSFGWEIACWEKTLQGVKGRTVGAMHKAACILMMLYCMVLLCDSNGKEVD